MVERKIELRRRNARRKKLLKLKKKLAGAKDNRERDAVLTKIRVISPWWKEKAGEAVAAAPVKSGKK